MTQEVHATVVDFDDRVVFDKRFEAPAITAHEYWAYGPVTLFPFLAAGYKLYAGQSTRPSEWLESYRKTADAHVERALVDALSSLEAHAASKAYSEGILQ